VHTKTCVSMYTNGTYNRTTIDAYQWGYNRYYIEYYYMNMSYVITT